MLDKHRMRETVQEHVDAENAVDVARVLATYGRESPIFEDVAGGIRCVGGEQIIAEYRNVWDGFPRFTREVARWTLGEDSVVIEVIVFGKHEGPFRGMPPSGREISLRGIAHFQFDSEGRIQQETVYYDSLTILRQLGIAALP